MVDDEGMVWNGSAIHKLTPLFPSSAPPPHPWVVAAGAHNHKSSTVLGLLLLLLQHHIIFFGCIADSLRLRCNSSSRFLL